MTVNQTKNPTFNCFIAYDLTLQYGKLELRDDELHFKYVLCNGKSEHFKYNLISKVEIEKKLRNQIQFLRIQILNQKYRFLGLHQLDYISSEIQKHQMKYERQNVPPSKSSESIDTAKQPNESDDIKKVELVELPKIDVDVQSKSVEINEKVNPSQVEFVYLQNSKDLYFRRIPHRLDKVVSRYLNNASILKVLNETGNQNIVISQWADKDGYRERTISYTKCVDISIFGKQYINVVETQHYYDIGETKAFSIASSLEHSLYSNCFDPYVQLIFQSDNQNVNFSVKFEMKWKKELLFKNVVESKTQRETQSFYVKLAKELFDEIEDLNEVDSTQTDNELQNEKCTMNNTNAQNQLAIKDKIAIFNNDYKTEAAFLSLLFFIYLMKSSKLDRRNSYKSPVFFSKILIILFSQYVLFSILL